MRRYTSLLLTAFLLFILVVAGSAYFAGAGHDDRTRPLREIVVYTTLPAEHAAILTNAYEQSHNVRANFVPLASDELLKRLQKLRRLNLKPLTMLMKPKRKMVNSLMKLAKLKRKKVSQKGLSP